MDKCCRPPIAMPRKWRRLAGKAEVGGSDAHTIECLGRTYTGSCRRAHRGGVPGRLETRRGRGARRIGRLLEADPRGPGHWLRDDAGASLDGFTFAADGRDPGGNSGEPDAGDVVRLSLGTQARPRRYATSGSFSALRLFLGVVVGRDLLQVFRLEDLIAIQTAEIIDSVAPHQEFRAFMFTARHRKLEYPYSSQCGNVVKPPAVLRRGFPLGPVY